MKNVLHLVLSITALAALTVSQLPSIGRCEMTSDGVFAAHCAMSCCKTQAMPHCPFLKTSAPKDLIANAAPIFKITLAPLHTASRIILPAFHPIVLTMPHLTEMLQLLFSGTPHAVRAPPQDIYLVEA
jgi:hypothetical protein